MNYFLAKMAESLPTDEDQLHTALSELEPNDLQELARDSDLTSPAPQVDATLDRFHQADRMGRELAHSRHAQQIEKEAMLGAALTAGRALLAGGGGKKILGSLAKGVVADQAVSGISGALTKSRQAAGQAAGHVGGGFKYAGVIQSTIGALGGTQGGNTFLRGAAARAMRNPHMTAAMIGAGAGAVKGLVQDPGVDPQTGQRRSRLGAMARNAAGGAAIGGAVSHIPGVKRTIQAGGKGLSREVRRLPPPGGATPHLPVAGNGPAGGGGVLGGGPAAAPAVASPHMAHGTPPNGVPIHVEDSVQGQLNALRHPTSGPSLVDRAESQLGPQRAAAAYNAEPDFSHLPSPGGQVNSHIMMPKQGPLERAKANLSNRLEARRQAKINRPVPGAAMASPEWAEQVKLASLNSVERMKYLVEKNASIADRANSIFGKLIKKPSPALPSMKGFKSIAGGSPVGNGKATITARPGSGW